MPAPMLARMATRMGLRRGRGTKVVPFDGDAAESALPRDGGVQAGDLETGSFVERLLGDAAGLARAVAEAEERAGHDAPDEEAEGSDEPRGAPPAKSGAETPAGSPVPEESTATVDSLTYSQLSEDEGPELYDLVRPLGAGCAPRTAEDEHESAQLRTYSQLSEDEGPELYDLVRPPLIPGPLRVHPEMKKKNAFNGHWVLCSPKGDTSDSLDHLTIDGSQVVDGVGVVCQLTEWTRGPKLFGGRLKARGDVLYRIGKTKRVQCYLRSE